MKSFKISFLLCLVVISACSASLEEHAAQTPEFHLFEFFEGKTKAWGMVKDYKGNQIRRFEVDIVGTVSGQMLTLEEDFVYADGKTQRRVWYIQKTDKNTFVGNAEDVIGEAIGQVQGNALNWKYTLRLKTENGEIDLALDDWMFRQDDKRMFNVAKMKKFGIEVGQIILFFEKQSSNRASVRQSDLADYHVFPAAMKEDDFIGWQAIRGGQAASQVFAKETDLLYSF